MKYDHLLQKISQNSVLAKAVRLALETDRDDVLNLVNTDWKQQLRNCNLTQKYCDRHVSFSPPSLWKYIKVQKVKHADDIYKILVVGLFTIYKNVQDGKTNFVFYTKECPPLDEITHILAGEDAARLELSPNGKFMIDTCGYTSCRYCPKEASKYNMPVDFQSPWWCVAKTKVFNGDSVKSVFRHTIERDFLRSAFVGILTITITGKQFYGDRFDKMKLIGNVEHMILFKEQALDAKCDMSDAFFDDRRIFIPHACENGGKATNIPTHDSTTHAITTFTTVSGKDSFSPNFLFTPNVIENPHQNMTAAEANSSTITVPLPTTSRNVDEPTVQELMKGDETVVDCIPYTYRPSEENGDDNMQEFEIQHVKRFKLDN